MSFLRFLVILPKLVQCLIDLHQYFKDKDVQDFIKEVDVATNELKEAPDATSKRLAAVKLINIVRKL